MLKGISKKHPLAGDHESVFQVVYTGDKANPFSRHVIVREDVTAEAIENVKKFMRQYNAERRAGK
jgi:hypothetical protein